ncbi:uncharacterized protein LOC135492392 isoform X1 [Lineus longissimus]|uniref:uncharacterized protein LOC135492392 isoform X1 n=1 Tax=Lineus longissimus TaxID=88925 RepID=UPI002B4F8A81
MFGSRIRMEKPPFWIRVCKCCRPSQTQMRSISISLPYNWLHLKLCFLLVPSVIMYMLLFARLEIWSTTNKGHGVVPLIRNKRGNIIPHRLHQLYKDENIPKDYQRFIKSWIKHHPKWEYWFWSDQDARRLIMDYYPEHLVMYDSYSNNLLRSDAARYFILYHYGGVYADMDMEALRPIDKYLSNYTCVLSQEPSFQSALLFNKVTIAMNAWMACAKYHDFMDYVIRSLSKFAKPTKHISEAVKMTGPLMLQESLEKFRNKTGCNRNNSTCSVTVAPSKLFMPTWDQGRTAEYKRWCKNKKKLPKIKQDACKELEALNFINVISCAAYANHKFMHIGYKNGGHKSGADSMYISTIVPQVFRYSGKRMVPRN